MTDFSLYLNLGLTHILDLNGYDHILFVTTLCLVYQWKNYKEVGILVTAFTIGHSVTLGLAVLDLINFNPDVIEFLIPVTIMLASIENIVVNKLPNFNQAALLRYITAGTFGLIHGLGFSNYLRMLLMDEQGIGLPLFAFNIGLEVGQLAIVTLVLSLNYLIFKLLPKQFNWYIITGSSAIGITALVLLLG